MNTPATWFWLQIPPTEVHLLILLTAIAAALAVPVQDGDVIFQTSQSSQSEAIQLATDSPYSHVGVITIVDGKPMVFEAIGKVTATPLKQWIARGTGGRYRLMRPQQPLTPAQIQAMKVAGQRYRGKSYDLRFEWSDSKMYCSELVWKIYQEGAGLELSKLRPMESYRLGHPTVRKLLKARWGDDIHWQEPMVAPSDLAESTSLMVIHDTTRH